MSTRKAKQHNTAGASKASLAKGKGLGIRSWQRHWPIAAVVGLTGLLSLPFFVPFPGSSVQAGDITVYKTPTCGCCKKWVDHLEAAGYSVVVKDRDYLGAIKQRFGIGPQHQSCHTAIASGYVIEGHVPAKDINRLLKERPNVHGLAVPGMPMGSPGMEGPRTDRYAVLALDKQGNSTVFARY